MSLSLQQRYVILAEAEGVVFAVAEVDTESETLDYLKDSPSGNYYIIPVTAVEVKNTPRFFQLLDILKEDNNG